MFNIFNKKAFGIVEILIAIAFFSIAILPLITLFSSSMDTMNIITARSRATLFAQEIMSQAVLGSFDQLDDGNYDFSSDEVATYPDFAKKWLLCKLPPFFSRKMEIREIEIGGEKVKQIMVEIKHDNLSQADLKWYRKIGK